MRNFIKKTVLFILAAFIFLHVAAYVLLATKIYQTHVLGSEIYYSIAKSKKKSKSKKVIMGDSVAQQFFNNKSTNYPFYSLACNQSISMVGQFLLLHNYIEAGNTVDTVFFVSTPFSFQNNLNQIYTFQYFLKPFYNSEYSSLFTPLVNEKIEKIPYHNISGYPLIKTTNWSPDYTVEKDSSFTFLSPLSVEYLHKLKDLSVQHHFKIILLPTPTPFSKKKDVAKLNINEAVSNGLQPEFDTYLDKLVFLDDNEFLDKVHLKDPPKYASYFDAFIK
jgi:hypothetical protein